MSKNFFASNGKHSWLAVKASSDAVNVYKFGLTKGLSEEIMLRNISLTRLPLFGWPDRAQALIAFV